MLFFTISGVIIWVMILMGIVMTAHDFLKCEKETAICCIGGPCDGDSCKHSGPVLTCESTHKFIRNGVQTTIERSHKYIFDGKNYVYTGLTHFATFKEIV